MDLVYKTLPASLLSGGRNTYLGHKHNWSCQVSPSAPAHSLANRSQVAGVTLHNWKEEGEVASLRTRASTPVFPQLSGLTAASFLIHYAPPSPATAESLMRLLVWGGKAVLHGHSPWLDCAAKASQFHCVCSSKRMEMWKLEISSSQLCCMSSLGGS